MAVDEVYPPADSRDYVIKPRDHGNFLKFRGDDEALRGAMALSNQAFYRGREVALYGEIARVKNGQLTWVHEAGQNGDKC